MHLRRMTTVGMAAALMVGMCGTLVGQGPAEGKRAGLESVMAPEPSFLTLVNSANFASEPPESSAAGLPNAPSFSMADAQAYPTGSTYGKWRLGISVYGFFPGVHGTLGAKGHNAGIHSSFSDVFSSLKGIIPIAVEADKGRFLAPVDFFWVKMGFTGALPLNDRGQTSIDTNATQSILTGKLGYRLYDGDDMKMDVFGGIRYWYASLRNTLMPSGAAYSSSTNWVDGLGGARFVVPFGEKVAFTASGDAGAGESDVDYQAVGLLNFNVTEKFGLSVGWRYLYDNYRPVTNQLVYNPTMTGPLAGFTFNTGGKPPAPPTLSCAAAPGQVYPGDPVTVTGSPEGVYPDWHAVYAWSGDGVTANGSTANVNTSALTPGSYTVHGEIKVGKEGKEGLKPWQNASCTASYVVKEFEPPTLSCSASPAEVKPGETATVTARGVSPQNRPLVYSYQATKGTVSGAGGTATFSSAGADAGPVGITCSVSDDKGHTVSASASVTILRPPPPPPPPPSLLLHSVFFPTALPNEEHPEKGLAESQEQILTTLATDFKAYLEVKPDARLTLTGHADPRGSAEYNQALTERRVGSVKNFLVEQGVPEASIDTVALGDTKALSKDEVRSMVESNPELTDAERAKILRDVTQIYLAQNRRVDVTLANTGQQSAQVYPFNAHDAETLLSERAQPHAKKRRGK